MRVIVWFPLCRVVWCVFLWGCVFKLRRKACWQASSCYSQSCLKGLPHYFLPLSKALPTAELYNWALRDSWQAKREGWRGILFTCERKDEWITALDILSPLTEMPRSDSAANLLLQVYFINRLTPHQKNQTPRLWASLSEIRIQMAERRSEL